MSEEKKQRVSAKLVITVLDSGEVQLKHIFEDKAGTATQQEREEDYKHKIQRLADYLNN